MAGFDKNISETTDFVSYPNNVSEKPLVDESLVKIISATLDSNKKALQAMFDNNDKLLAGYKEMANKIIDSNQEVTRHLIQQQSNDIAKLLEGTFYNSICHAL